MPLSVLTLLLAIACDRSSSKAPSTSSAIEASASGRDILKRERGEENLEDKYDLMLSRYSPYEDSSYWCYAQSIATGRERRVVELLLKFAEAVVLTPIEAETMRDSASTAASITRLVAALPTDSTTPLFGVPFTVRRAVQGSVASDPPGHDYMIAVLVRRLPQEDRQLEEQVVVVARRTANSPVAPWQLMWHERATGSEEQLAVTDPYALFRVRSSGVPAVALVRESATATWLVVVAGETEGVWRVRWERAIAPCGSSG